MDFFWSEELAHASKHLTPWHHHEAGQVYWLTQGMISLTTRTRQWALTPGCAGWLPPGCEHRAVACGDMRGWSLFLPQALCRGMPTAPSLIPADAFLQALLARLSQAPAAFGPAQRRLVTVMKDEFRAGREAALQLPLPEDKRALYVAQRLLEAPAENPDQQTLARHAGLSVRTLSRLFLRQTGMSFARWRQQAKILRSLEALAAGAPVADAAVSAGYENISAYIAAFRERFGVTPGRYFPGPDAGLAQAMDNLVAAAAPDKRRVF